VSGNPINLAVGATNNNNFTGTYVITQADIDAGKVQNQATATGVEPDGDQVSDLSDDNSPLENEPTVTILPQNPLIDIDKEGTFDLGEDGIANPGDIITYTFDVTNIGNVSLFNVEITDILSGLSTIDLSAFDGELSPGESFQATATYAVNQSDIDAGEVNNETTVIAENPDGEPASATDSDLETVPIPQNPSLVINKQGTFIDQDGNGGISAGDKLSYTFDVTNDGNVNITGVIINEVFFELSNAIAIIAPADTNLSPGETQQWQGTYTLTEADVTNLTNSLQTNPEDIFIENIASATGEDPTGNDVESNQDQAQIPITLPAPIPGQPIELLYVIDISHSSLERFDAPNVGDVNDDGFFNTRLDAAISALKQVTEHLAKQSDILDGTEIKLGILTYSDGSNGPNGLETVEFLETFFIEDIDIDSIHDSLLNIRAEESDPWISLLSAYGLDLTDTDGLTNPDSALDRALGLSGSGEVGGIDFFSDESEETDITKMMIFTGAGTPNISGDGDGEGFASEFLWRKGYNSRALQFDSELALFDEKNVEILGLNLGNSDYLDEIDSLGNAFEYDTFDNLLSSGRLDGSIRI
jgi:uncharacterized repeat protein (TIGR01451 family)